MAQPISLIFIIIICLLPVKLKAQIGNLGGFNTIDLAYKNDLVLSVGKNFSQSLKISDDRLFKDFKNYDLQAGYAINKFLSVQAGYHSFFVFNDDSLNLCSGKGCEQAYNNHYFNLAIGAFYTHDLTKTLFLKNNKKDHKLINKAHILFNVYLGYGKGFNKRSILLRSRQYQEEWYWDSAFTLKFDNYYLQPNFMFNGNFIGGGFSAFYGLLKFNKIVLFGEQRNSTLGFIEEINEKPTAQVYGLNFKLWIGIKQLKLVYNVNRKYIINNENYNEYYNDVFNNYSDLFSIQINLADMFNRTSKK